ncbi:MAG TPA: hypothetical protein V6D19_06595 [Stenomitos sp.]
MTAIRNGCSIPIAANLAGIPSRTVEDWLSKGRKLENADIEPEPGTQARGLLDFLRLYQKARSEYIATHVGNINSHATADRPGAWTASAWVLERKQPKEFSQKYLIEKIAEQRVLDLVRFLFQGAPTELFREQLAQLVQLIPDLNLSEASDDL